MFSLIINWAVGLLILLADIRLLFVILGLKEDRLLFGLLQFLVINDCLGSSVAFWHDVPSFIIQKSVIANIYPLYIVAVVFQSLQFFYGLLMLPIFALSNCAAVQFPFWYNTARKKLTYAIVVVLYLITGAMTAPLFTSCCGYSYNETALSWYYDYSKPQTELYKVAFFWLQMFCASVMILCLLFILFKLYQIHSKMKGQILPAKQVTVNHIPIPSHTTTNSSVQPTLTFQMNPRERLAVSFVLLAICFLIGTGTFNFLGWSSPVASAITMSGNQLNKAKWIIYSLFLPDVRASFFCLQRR